MRLLGRDTLSCLQKRNEMMDKWLVAWVCELANARWWCSGDVINQFPKVQERSDSLFLFKTEPNGYCIEVQFAFPQGIALITALTEDDNERD